jgi:hypothetical protein
MRADRLLPAIVGPVGAALQAGCVLVPLLLPLAAHSSENQSGGTVWSIPTLGDADSERRRVLVYNMEIKSFEDAEGDFLVVHYVTSVNVFDYAELRSEALLVWRKHMRKEVEGNGWSGCVLRASNGFPADGKAPPVVYGFVFVRNGDGGWEEPPATPEEYSGDPA